MGGRIVEIRGVTRGLGGKGGPALARRPENMVCRLHHQQATNMDNREAEINMVDRVVSTDSKPMAQGLEYPVYSI